MAENPGLQPAVSKNLDFPGLHHGFFTRAGGVSSGLYQSLNAGPGSHDMPLLVTENRARIAAHFGVMPQCLLSPYQFHSADVVVVGEPFSGERPRADAIVTATRGLAIGVVTADCGPLLMVDPDAGIIGAAHAGWQGAIGGVIENTLQAMESLGAVRKRMTAVLGPTISQYNYEVGLDFKEKILGSDQAGCDFFTLGKTPEKWQFDLPGFIMMRLTKAGVAAFSTDLCTYAHPQQFFSYRRSTHQAEPDYGRQISAICLV